MNACCSKSPREIETTSHHAMKPKTHFWRNASAWKRSAKNTFNCLIGCSIGDFAMFFFLQYKFPNMPMLLVMVLAMASGLLTSITLETVILKITEGFDWKRAVKVAVSMSFISMLAMELTENLVNLALTGGSMEAMTPWFWTALIISMIAGFLVPLPYNYYQLARHGKACH